MIPAAASALRAWCRAALEGRPAALGEIRDWPALLTLAREERLTPLLHANLVTFRATTGVPPAVRDALTADYRSSVGQTLVRERAWTELLGRLRRARVEPLVLKGMAFAGSLWRDPAARPMDDVDLLVRRRDVEAAARVLTDVGYTAESLGSDLDRRAASQFTPPGGRSRWPVVDLHWDLVDVRYGGAAGRWSDGVWARAMSIDGAGGPMTVLSREDALIEAATHLVAHHGLRGLLWCCDVALLGRPPLAWPRVAALAAEGRLSGLVFAAVRAAALALGAAAPITAMQVLRPRSALARGVCRLAVPRLAAGGRLPLTPYLLPPLLLESPHDLVRLALWRWRR